MVPLDQKRACIQEGGLTWRDGIGCDVHFDPVADHLPVHGQQLPTLFLNFPQQRFLRLGIAVKVFTYPQNAILCVIREIGFMILFAVALQIRLRVGTKVTKNLTASAGIPQRDHTTIAISFRSNGRIFSDGNLCRYRKDHIHVANGVPSDKLRKSIAVFY